MGCGMPLRSPTGQCSEEFPPARMCPVFKSISASVQTSILSGRHRTVPLVPTLWAGMTETPEMLEAIREHQRVHEVTP